jgi:GNAT superfamily N-acetyltransferase
MDTLTTSPVEVRSCKAEDFDAILPLLHQLYPDKTFDLALLQCAYGRLLVSDQWVFLCAVRDQRIIGFGSLTIKTNLLWCGAMIGYVSDMVVDGEYRGRRIGTRILDGLISWARGRDCHRIELNASLERKGAHAFYEHRGFKRGAYFYSKLL